MSRFLQPLCVAVLCGGALSAHARPISDIAVNAKGDVEILQNGAVVQQQSFGDFTLSATAQFQDAGSTAQAGSWSDGTLTASVFAPGGSDLQAQSHWYAIAVNPFGTPEDFQFYIADPGNVPGGQWRFSVGGVQHALGDVVDFGVLQPGQGVPILLSVLADSSTCTPGCGALQTASLEYIATPLTDSSISVLSATPVPEAPVWAMALAGLGVLSRRRRARS